MSFYLICKGNEKSEFQSKLNEHTWLGQRREMVGNVGKPGLFSKEILMLGQFFFFYHLHSKEMI